MPSWPVYPREAYVLVEQQASGGNESGYWAVTHSHSPHVRASESVAIGTADAGGNDPLTQNQAVELNKWALIQPVAIRVKEQTAKSWTSLDAIELVSVTGAAFVPRLMPVLMAMCTAASAGIRFGVGPLAYLEPVAHR
jgi:hypothetical protein